jgi:hypothetical protein
MRLKRKMGAGFPKGMSSARAEGTCSIKKLGGRDDPPPSAMKRDRPMEFTASKSLEGVTIRRHQL